MFFLEKKEAVQKNSLIDQQLAWFLLVEDKGSNEELNILLKFWF